MIYVQTPLTEAVRRAVAEWWGVDGEGTRLHGGEESAAYRLGDHVVRVGPAWRGTAEIEWCHAIALHAATGLPEAVAPLPTAEGATVVRVEGRPVSVWPYVEGSWSDSDEPGQRVQGARLLARLHEALATARPGPRPVPAFQEFGLYGVPGVPAPAGDRSYGVPAVPPAGDASYGAQGVPPAGDPLPDGATPAELADPRLDRWLAEFHRTHPRRHPLHGDYYTGNTLARDGVITAVLDWDEAFVGAPEVELAAAALEWGDDELDPSREFVAAYLEAGGTAGKLDDEALAQLIRHRLRREAAYFHKAVARGVVHDEEDLDYHRERVELFHRLRP
ncbi:phosphotransferase enzyme family protein [Sphaerisporangium fuscum]|uniref:phosphotransferase enzyme family protein n=1 Tax=Sphaerisporangium fuscum TaxID=2835868 RepID=UPI001BDCF786|nr:phosphotransferase [Sphaerisporangium fuscum]